MGGVLLSELDYDFVVLGTGLAESVLAAALSYSGARVLHLDANPFYGGQCATQSLASLKSLISDEQLLSDGPTAADASGPAADSDAPLSLPSEGLPDGAEVHALTRTPFARSAFPRGAVLLPPSTCAPSPLSADLDKRVHLDLAPKTLLAAGGMVDLMVKTRVGHYVDFRALDASYVHFGAYGLRHVPASRSDIFQDRFITMLEKRLLMRFMKNALHASSSSASLTPATSDEDDSAASAETATFEQSMRMANLTDKLKKFLNYAVALSDADATHTSSQDAAHAISVYQQSLLKFGTRTPFLYPNYGSAELAQAFCRLCAVTGGTYVLRRGATAIVSAPAKEGAPAKRRVVGVVTALGELVRCRAVFGAADALAGPALATRAENAADDKGAVVWRAACVVDGSLVRGDAQRALLIVPRGTLGNAGATVRIRQLDPAVGVCPPGKYVVYAETVGAAGCEADLRAVLAEYVAMGGAEGDAARAPGAGGAAKEARGDASGEAAPGSAAGGDAPVSCEAESKPNLLWGVVYSRRICAGPPVGHAPGGIDGVGVLGETGAEPDAASAIAEARRWFEHVMPGVEFFATEVEDEEEAGADAGEAEEGDPEKGDVEEDDKSGTTI